MKKKVKVDQLKPGMFICDFNCGWLKHPFLSSSLKVKNEKIVEKIVKSGIREVFIDTDKGLDVACAPAEEEVRQEIQTEPQTLIEPEIRESDLASVQEETAKAKRTEKDVNIAVQEIKEDLRLGKQLETGSDSVSVQEELVEAKEIKKEAKQTVQKVMEDIRLGKQIEMEKVDNVVNKMVDSIFRNKDALTSLGRIKTVDEYTFFHSISVSVLMITFSKYIGFDYELVKTIGIGGLLHDVGKMQVPVEILTKQGRLSEDEYAKIKEHVKHSYNIIEQIPGINEASIYVAAHHHERLDGTGYPYGLKGEQISIFGQMAAIADVYDAMTSDRCYQKGILPTEVLRKLFEWSEFHFNRDLVQQFIRCVGIYPVGTLVRLTSGLLGVILNHDEINLLYPVVRIVFDTKKEKHITPYDVDLSQSSDNGGADRVICHEIPDKWCIKPEM
jgi:putative nucleotidyltransferase with HDIG domain